MSACDAGFFSRLFSGNAIVCSSTFEDALTTSAKAQIQSTADLTAQNYGADSPAAQIGQQVADLQESQVGSDVSAILKDVSNSNVGKTCDDGSPGIDLTIVGLPCVKYSWLKWGAIGAAALFVLYVVALGRSFLPSGR